MNARRPRLRSTIINEAEIKATLSPADRVGMGAGAIHSHFPLGLMGSLHGLLPRIGTMNQSQSRASVFPGRGTRFSLSPGEWCQAEVRPGVRIPPKRNFAH